MPEEVQKPEVKKPPIYLFVTEGIYIVRTMSGFKHAFKDANQEAKTNKNIHPSQTPKSFPCVVFISNKPDENLEVEVRQCHVNRMMSFIRYS